MRRGFALPLLCVLAGCTGLLHSTAPPEQTYYLRAPQATLAAGGVASEGGSAAAAPVPRAASVRVARPAAAPGLDSPHIMLVRNDQRMDFYSGSRWPGAAPDVIGALAVQTLRASGAWSSVEDAASPFPSDYLLQITLRRFEADYTSGGAAPTVYVTLECIIGHRQGREVIATFVAAASAPAGANRQGEVVAAFEQAATAALGELAQRAAQAVQRDAPQRAIQNADSPLPSNSR